VNTTADAVTPGAIVESQRSVWELGQVQVYDGGADGLAATEPNGVFARHHTDDVLVDWKGQAPTHGIDEHIEAMKAYVESAGGTPPQITSHPIAFGSGEWTCVIGEFEGGGRMVTVARWVDGAIAEEYIWS